ncbi:GNAT family N-acetyltransferase [Rhizomonospora bruguierae]|uniref:GNAT family N-acetyltransferase n=1 Tax=Rhizomonospora bruguierae TaxID=1581705 RepID=UPI001BD0CA69|nr:GNAT family N-acetyltransferase [Micromonospora sp. NBRC 107566]
MDGVGIRSPLRVAELTAIGEHQAAAALLTRIWQAASPAQLVSADLMRALAHSGNYVAGAYQGNRLVGAAIAFFGADHLHSHITGVDPGCQRLGVGGALKQHQRAWAHRRGLAEIRWTFDPLVRRNARFNLLTLGAVVRAYLPDFYGDLADAVNQGDASDRLYVAWDVRDAAPRPPDTLTGARVILDDLHERPVSLAERGGDRVAVAVPADVEALRRRDPRVAAWWRQEVRTALGGALADGYRVIGFTAGGQYLLSRWRPPST